jgi:2-polyprenyl-6-hydroxyphenyl methylase/3-demethylubiquinone-9 3-methyltransferase
MEEPQYRYFNAAPTWANAYLWPVVKSEALAVKRARPAQLKRAMDLGCGNGATAGMLSDLGFDVTGIDASESGIAHAEANYPSCHFEVASVYDNLRGRYGEFPLVVSLEVVEHLYDPRKFARVLYSLLAPSGTAIVSTPYHGYLKNVALAVTGKLDGHFSALWDGGHIKFFSIATLRQLLSEAGLQDIRFARVGRIPPLAKSMVAVARKPQRL